MGNFSNKAIARRYFLDKRLAMTEEEIISSSQRLCSGIAGLKEFYEADTLLLFYPTRKEPHILPLVQTALDMGKSVAFPISLTNTNTLTFRNITSISELKEGTYKIPEPPFNAPAPNTSNKSLCIVPALAFDKDGFRIGYGKGYYDRFLSTFQGISVGAAPNGHLCEKLPTEHTDIPVDIIITETGVIRIK